MTYRRYLRQVRVWWNGENEGEQQGRQEPQKHMLRADDGSRQKSEGSVSIQEPGPSRSRRTTLLRHASLSKVHPEGTWCHAIHQFFQRLTHRFLTAWTDANGGGVFVLEQVPEAFWVVFSYYFAFMAVVIYFIVSLTMQNMSVSYLSTKDTNDDQTCTPIPIVVVNTIEGDVYGTWNTLPGFQQNNSIFQLSFTGSNITNDVYQSTMLKFKDKLRVLSSKSDARDTAWNMVMWSTFTFYDQSSQMTFTSSSDAGIIYSAGDVLAGFLTSARGGPCYCPGNSTAPPKPTVSCTNYMERGYFDIARNRIVYSVPTNPFPPLKVAGFNDDATAEYIDVRWNYPAPCPAFFLVPTPH